MSKSSSNAALKVLGINEKDTYKGFHTNYFTIVNIGCFWKGGKRRGNHSTKQFPAFFEHHSHSILSFIQSLLRQDVLHYKGGLFSASDWTSAD